MDARDVPDVPDAHDARDAHDVPDAHDAPAAYTLAELLTAQRSQDHLYHEFLRVPALSAGLYVLPAGGADPQQPHTEDEVYYVVGGRATIRVAQEDRAVAAGSIVYVPATVPHHFHSIEEELTVLVFFAPAEYTNRPAQPTDATG